MQSREHLAMGSGEAVVPGGWGVLPSGIHDVKSICAYLHTAAGRCFFFFTLVSVLSKRNWLAGEKELNLFHRIFRGLC